MVLESKRPGRAGLASHLPSHRPALALVLLMLAGAAQAQGNCESIRAGIEAKIRAAGVADVSVVTVDAASSAPGREVGRCERGSRKILYQRSAAGAAPTTAVTPPAAQPAVKPAVKPAAAAAPVITECKDGRVTVGGDCRR